MEDETRIGPPQPDFEKPPPGYEELGMAGYLTRVADAIIDLCASYKMSDQDLLTNGIAGIDLRNLEERIATLLMGGSSTVKLAESIGNRLAYRRSMGDKL